MNEVLDNKIHQLRERLPKEWLVAGQYNIDYLRYEIAISHIYETEIFVIQVYYQDDDMLEQWWESDMERFTFLNSTFPASRVLFKQMFRRYDNDTPFFVGYRFLIEHKLLGAEIVE